MSEIKSSLHQTNLMIDLHIRYTRHFLELRFIFHSDVKVKYAKRKLCLFLNYKLQHINISQLIAGVFVTFKFKWDK
jgi:hypothetical protein